MQLVLFDLDGTLIDSESGIVGSMLHAFAQMEVTASSREILRSFIGPPLRQSFPQVVGDDPERVERAVGHYRERFDALGWQEHEVYPGIAELVSELAGGGRQLAIVTTKVQVQAQRIIDHLPFGRHFARVYGPDGDGRHNEKAEMIADALRDFQVKAGQAVMIGDRNFDMLGARANDVRAVGVSWGFGSVEELQNAGAQAIAGAPIDLIELIHPDSAERRETRLG
ncbi:MAG: HAD hydrolase-like protein [Tahibacter sp.]